MARIRKTILCIDDHWTGLISRKMFLESHGYEVLDATGGEEGLQLFRTHFIDAVVLAYQMPGMNGDVIAKKMKRMKSHIIREPESDSNRSRIFSRSRNAYMSGVPQAPISLSKNPRSDA